MVLPPKGTLAMMQAGRTVLPLKGTLVQSGGEVLQACDEGTQQTADVLADRLS